MAYFFITNPADDLSNRLPLNRVHPEMGERIFNARMRYNAVTALAWAVIFSITALTWAGAFFIGSKVADWFR